MKSVPSDYYERLAAIDASHWWARGMIEIEAAYLQPWLARGSLTLLDAGCGPGGFLAWARGTGRFATLAGVDLSPEAVEVARRRVPGARLAVAPVGSLPFEQAAFDVVALNDVLQHIDEAAVQESLAEVRRVLRPDGALVLRTGGARRARSERADWRVYDPDALRAELARSGLRVRRVSYANTAFSALAQVRGRRPHAPTGETCGIPPRPGSVSSFLGRLSLRAEAQVASMGGRLPWGHTLVALAVPA